MPSPRQWFPFALALAVAGCGGGDESGSPQATQTPQPAPPAGRCQPATSALMTPLSNKLSVQGGFLENGQVVKSRDHDNIYFVSAEIEGPGFLGSGHIATWATTSLGGAEAIYTVDELSRKHSDWRDGTKVAGLSPEDDGVLQSRRCVSR